jgi:hypothetical protein
MTLCFSQAAVVSAATKSTMVPVYVSPFVGRLDDIGENGVDLVANIKRMYAAGDGHVAVLASQHPKSRAIALLLFRDGQLSAECQSFAMAGRERTLDRGSACRLAGPARRRLTKRRLRQGCAIIGDELFNSLASQVIGRLKSFSREGGVRGRQ